MEWDDEKKQFFKAAYREVSEILIRIAYRITSSREVAEDLCHEAFIKLCERHKQIPDQAQIKYWLIRVVKNMSLNYAKRQQREFRAYERILNESPGVSPDTGAAELLRQESTHAVQRALHRLPQKLREVLVLIEYGRLSYREIGRILNITESNVKVRAFRARKKMATFLRKDGIDVPE